MSKAKIIKTGSGGEAAEHYLRMDLVLQFLDIAWAEGVESGKSGARQALSETRRSFPSPESCEALSAFERSLRRVAPDPLPTFREALMDIMRESSDSSPTGP